MTDDVAVQTPIPAPTVPKRVDFKNPRTIRIAARIVILLVTIVGAFSMPLALVLEYPGDQFLSYYVSSYPHMTFYPMIFFWCAGICLVSAWAFVPIEKSNIKKINQIFAVTLFTSLVLTFVEQTGPRMMAFEFSAGAQERFCMRAIVTGAPLTDETAQKDHEKKCLEEYTKIAKSLNLPGSDDGSFNRQHVNDQLFSPSFWNDITIDGHSPYSYTRYSYIVTVFSIIFIMTLSYASYLLTPISSKGRKRFFIATMFGIFFLLFWIPIRAYYNSTVKTLVFSPENTGIVDFNLSHSEIIILFVFILFIIMIIAKIFSIDADKAAIVQALVPLFAGVFFVLQPEMAARVFGLGKNPQPQIWVYWIVFCIFMMWIVYGLLSRGDNDDDDNPN